MSESLTTSGSSFVARLSADQATCGAILDLAAESFDGDEVAASSHERAGDGWTVELHFRNPPNEAAVRGVIALAAGADIANALTFETIAARDWVKASLDGLSPVRAGRFVVHGAHDRARIAPNTVGIEIEAALAFGTGHHGTTRGCLLALDRIVHREQPARVLDVGTGSGVLAIAAAKALRRSLQNRIAASDIDPRSVIVARENAALNRVGPLIDVFQAAGLGDRRFRDRGPYDLIFANILLAPLKRLAGPLSRLLTPGGLVVLSGLLPSHANPALAAYRARGLVLEQYIPVDGWVTLVMRRDGQAPLDR
jgi:ribosomal protein L11 methyltransferase